MAVIKKEVEETVTPEKKTRKVELTHTLQGTYRDDKTGHHHIVVLKYNPETEDLGSLEIKRTDSKADSDFHFRKLAVESGNIG